MAPAGRRGSQSRNSVNGGWVGRTPTVCHNNHCHCQVVAAAARRPRAAASAVAWSRPLSSAMALLDGASHGPANGASNGASRNHGAGSEGMPKAGGGDQMPTGGGDGEEEDDEEEDEERECGGGSIVANAIEVCVLVWAVCLCRCFLGAQPSFTRLFPAHPVKVPSRRHFDTVPGSLCNAGSCGTGVCDWRAAWFVSWGCCPWQALKGSRGGSAASGGKEGGGSGVTLGNLINMVKDAEQSEHCGA